MKKGQIGTFIALFAFVIFLAVLFVFWLLTAKAGTNDPPVIGYCAGDKCLTTDELTLLGYLKQVHEYEGQIVNNADLIVHYYTNENPITKLELYERLGNVTESSDCIYGEVDGEKELLFGRCREEFREVVTTKLYDKGKEINVILAHPPIYFVKISNGYKAVYANE